MPEHEAAQKRRDRIAGFFTYAAGPFLVAYLLLLLGTTYVSQQDLRKASTNALLFNLEKRVSALSYFQYERRNDISALAKDPALDVYFSNRALGMSMEYGLRASLLSMRNKFQDLLDSKRIDTEPIYLRLLFIDTQGEQLVDVGVASGTPEPWFENEVLTTEGMRSVLIQADEHSHLLLLSPYHYKGKRIGTILAEINHSEVVRQLIQLQTAGQTPYTLLMRNSEHVLDYEHTVKGQPDPDNAYFENLPDQSSKEFSSFVKLPVPDSPFILAARDPEETSSDFLTSPWYLFSLGVLALLVLFSVVIGVRTRMRNLLLHARFEESEQQSQRLNEQNMLLEEEARKRHDSEIRLRTLIETIPDLVWLKDPDGVYLSCNPKFERVFGAKEADIVGKTDYDFADAELASFVRRHDKAAMAAGEPRMNEESVTYADDGHEELLETIKTPMRDGEGRLVGVLGIARDITERKRMENMLFASKERYLGLFQMSHDAIMTLVPPSWMFTAGNRATLAMFRAKDEAEFISHGPWDLSPEYQSDGRPSADKAKEMSETALRDGSNFFEWTHKRLNGEEFPATVLLSRIEQEGGVFLQATVRDITKAKEAEESLKLAKEEADAANQAKSEFLSRMSHELRTPLNAVLGFSEMLARDREKPLAPEQMKKVNEIRKAGSHLLVLVDEVLDLSSIDSGRLEVSLTPVACGELVQECLKLVGSLARERSVNVDFDKQEAAGKMVMADRTRLKQVLVNLLSNAVKYNKPEGWVSIEVKEKGNGRMLVSVTDTGPGIPPEWLGELFKPFRRLGAERSGVDGTGIGLTISKRLVELMGGGIGVESTPGEGSRFHVELPVAVEEAVLERGSEEEQDITPTEQAAGTYGGKVLLVEDNPVNREVAVGMLEYLDCEVEVAEEGEAALRRFKEGDYDLVLMDCEIPVMDGYEATRKIRRLEREGKRSRIPIIAVTAHAVQGSREKCLAAGMDEYLSKPFTLAGLEEVLEHWLT